MKLALSCSFDRTVVAEQVNDGDDTARLERLRQDVSDRDLASRQRSKGRDGGVEMAVQRIAERSNERPHFIRRR